MLFGPAFAALGVAAGIAFSSTLRMTVPKHERIVIAIAMGTATFMCFGVSVLFLSGVLP